jgi:uncharacterized damage-inducible protein DinB
MRLTTALLILFIATGVMAEDNPFSAHSRMMSGYIRMILLRSAEKMPAEHYDFRPSPDVRTFGQIVGHLSDAQYAMCSVVLGEKSPGLAIEKNKTSKADLVAALKESTAYCGRAYDSIDDKTGAETVKFFAGDTPRLGVLTVNHVHLMEHYGNLVTYMRMKGVVPPTSEPGFLQTPPKK